MTQVEHNYGVVLYELALDPKDIKISKECFLQTPRLKEILANPTISNQEKHHVMERIFPKSIQSFLKKVSDSGRINQIEAIFDAYENYKQKQMGVLKAELLYVTPPDQEQREGFIQFLKKKYCCHDVELLMKKEPELLGGFLLKIGSNEYDYSLKGRLVGLRQQIIRR